MTRYKGKEARNASRQRGQREEWPEMSERPQTEFEARLEREANKIVFRDLQPRNKKQAQLIHSLEEKRLVFASGPAGTGKTFVSTSFAIEELEAGNIEKIIITRPMVGCEEEMGFVPGSEYEKFAQWLGPFIDIFEGKLGRKKVETYMKFGKIQAKPLMTMRGSSFRNAIVILDEAQNTTRGQMKMFLTRAGEGSRIVIDGDVTQSDLGPGTINGMEDALHKLYDSPSIAIIEFVEDEIVRDPLVREILRAYRS